MSAPKSSLEFVREADFVEYFLFPHLPSELPNAAKSDEDAQLLRQHLEIVQQQCQAIVERHVKKHKYIWHKDEFQLQCRTGYEAEQMLTEELNGATVSLPHLHGVTHYGDNMADEWFIVKLLYAISSEISGIIVRVIDADGEFLLIEAAEMLPDWTNPDTCEQRVYISGGSLHLVQNSQSQTPQTISISAAISKLRLNPTLYRVSRNVQKCIDQRFEDFEDSHSYLHRQIIRVPLGVAALLKKQRNFIAAAVCAFCERDSVDLKACRAMRFFPPEQCVRTSVYFTRCLYAMLMHSNYMPERKIGWQLDGIDVNTAEYKERMLGIKVACGFEILASRAKSSENDAFESSAPWRTYIKSLTSKGYFRGNIEGCAEHARLLAAAKHYFQLNLKSFRTTNVVGQEILQLLGNVTAISAELRDAENNLPPSESDAWMNITADDLDAMLLKRYGTKRLFTSEGDIDANEFSKNFADFLDKESEWDGIDNDADNAAADDDADSDDEVNDDVGLLFDSAPSSSNKQKWKPMCNKQNAIIEDSDDDEAAETYSSARKQPSHENSNVHVRNFLDFNIPEDNWESNSDMSDYENDGDLERNINDMEAAEIDMNVMQEYVKQMDMELNGTTMRDTFKTNLSAASPHSVEEDNFDDIEDFEPININVNTLTHMMNSYKLQLGAAGPVSNLMSAMGVGMSAAAANVNTAAATTKQTDLTDSTI